jgi:uncharacterized protein (TIGR03067 family)
MVNTDLVQVSTLVRTSTFELHRGTPSQMDMATVNHHDQSKLFTKAIYKLEGDRLTYCVAAPGQPRPTEFTTKPDDGNTLVVLQRSGRL